MQPLGCYRPCPTLGSDFNHLVVVVLFGEREDEAGRIVANNYVVTAWAVFIYRQG